MQYLGNVLHVVRNMAGVYKHVNQEEHYLVKEHTYWLEENVSTVLS